MFRSAMLFCLFAVGFLTLVVDANACHRCGHRRGYGYSGCGYGYHTYRVAKVYRTVRVPVQTCTMTCVATCDPCGNLTYTSTPTYTTTYVTQKVLIHSQVIGNGPLYGNYLNGGRRQVAGAAYGYGGYGYGAHRSPYQGGYGVGVGYGLGGGYRMGGYGAAEKLDSYVARYQPVEAEKTTTAKRVGVAF